MSYSKLLTRHVVSGGDVMIEPNKSCYLCNTVRDHPSYAVNSYWRKFKQHGGTCYFNAAAIVAIVTDLDPTMFLIWTP